MSTEGYHEVYPDAISLNVKAVSLKGRLVIALNVNVRSIELLDGYSLLLGLQEALPHADVALVLRGDRLASELFVRELRPRVPTLWSPKAYRLNAPCLEIWVSGELIRKVFSPLPSVSEVLSLLRELIGEERLTDIPSSPRAFRAKLTYEGVISDLISVPERSALFVLVSALEESYLYKLSYQGEILEVRGFDPHYLRLMMVGRMLGLWSPLIGKLALIDPLSLELRSELSLKPAMSLEALEVDYLPRYLVARPGEILRSDLRSDEALYLEELLVGGRTLGFLDGRGASAKLSWPMALARDGILVYLADVLNYSIRVLSAVRGEIRTLAGRGEVGIRDGGPSFARFTIINDIELLDQLVIVADEEHLGLRLVDRVKGWVRSPSLPEELADEVRAIRRVCRAPGVNEVFVSDARNVYRLHLEDDLQRLTLRARVLSLRG